VNGPPCQYISVHEFHLLDADNAKNKVHVTTYACLENAKSIECVSQTAVYRCNSKVQKRTARAVGIACQPSRQSDSILIVCLTLYSSTPTHCGSTAAVADYPEPQAA
jgi:hypothetical protein